MKKILVIDDLPENVFLIQDRLEHEGFEVITAYDGQNGIEKCINEKPDLVLLDVMMPEISGFEVCNHLVNNPATAAIPIILVTAKSTAEDTKEGLEAGAFDYIKKPFNRIELIARVNSALKFADMQKKLLLAEQKSTFSATMVTANHKIKQPLTLISLSSAAIKRELQKEEVVRENILNRLSFIEGGIKEISDVLNELSSIKTPEFSNYVKNIKMIDIDKNNKGAKSD